MPKIWSDLVIGVKLMLKGPSPVKLSEAMAKTWIAVMPDPNKSVKTKINLLEKKLPQVVFPGALVQNLIDALTAAKGTEDYKNNAKFRGLVDKTLTDIAASAAPAGAPAPIVLPAAAPIVPPAAAPRVGALPPPPPPKGSKAGAAVPPPPPPGAVVDLSAPTSLFITEKDLIDPEREVVTGVLHLSSTTMQDVDRAAANRMTDVDQLKAKFLAGEIGGEFLISFAVGNAELRDRIQAEVADLQRQVADLTEKAKVLSSRLLIDQIESSAQEMVKRWEEIDLSLKTLDSEREDLTQQLGRAEQGIIKVKDHMRQVTVRRDAKLKRADDFFRELIAKSPIEEAAEQAEKAKKRMADIRNQEGAAFDSLNREGIQYLEKKTEVADRLKLADQATTTLQQDRASLIQHREKLRSQMEEWAEKIGERMTVIERNWLHIEEIDVAPAAPAAPKPAAAAPAAPAPAAPTPVAAPATPAAALPQPADPDLFRQLGEYLAGLPKNPKLIISELGKNAGRIKDILASLKDPVLSTIYDQIMAKTVLDPRITLDELITEIEERLLNLVGANVPLAAEVLEAFRKGTA